MHVETIPINAKVAAVINEDSARIFDFEDISLIKKEKLTKLGIVPWGAENNLPDLMLEKIRASEVMSSNKFFNSLVAYGRGLDVIYPDNKNKDKNVKLFFKRNNPIKYLLEQFVDQKHFFFSVSLLIMDNDGKKIVKIKHKEAYDCRFEKNDPKTGKINQVFFAAWAKDPKEDEIQAYPLLDDDDPFTDLMVRMGKEPDPETGKERTPTKDRIFAIVTRFPTPGHKYYPFPAYAAHFNSGWYDVTSMIPVGKKAKMDNGLIMKYHVEIHKDYFPSLFNEERITDPIKQKARKTLEINNIKNFLAGIENAGKIWFSGYYIDPNGKEQHMIKINLIDTGKEGGDWIEDAEEASNIQCYSDGVHPSLIGAVPGKTKGNMSGTDKRELFTMKQALEKPFRDLTLIPYNIILEFNNWPEEIEFVIPDMLLTLLDTGSDAKISNPNPDNNDNNNN